MQQTISNYFHVPTSYFNEIYYTMETSTIKKTVEWLSADIAKQEPQLVSTIFDAQELQDAVGLDLDEILLEELVILLEGINWIVRTDKVGPNGTYYNIAPRVFSAIHPNKYSGKIIKRLTKVNNDGFCIIKTEKRCYRQLCQAKACLFFFDSQNRCIKGKLFLR